MDGNSYEYGPIIKVPSDPSSWPGWEALLAKRDRLLTSANRDSSIKQEDLVAYAEARKDWKSSDWKKSEIFKVGDDVSGEKEWEDVKGLPGRARRKALPNVGESMFLSFNLEVSADQVLWLTFLGGSGSVVTLNEVDVETHHPSGLEQQELLVPLRLKKGTHSVMLKVLGSSRTGDIEVRLNNPWTAVAKSKDWKQMDETDRLLLLADSMGPLASLKVVKTAESIAQKFTAESANLTTSLVAGDLEKRRETKILSRGEYNLPTGEALEPGVLNVMGSLSPGAPKNRLGLAQWLTDRDQPVVSRVLINRVWQRIFGEGLVRSPEDFGLQGRYPTHPELLDWLAVEWQDRGWDLKEMIRLMVTSRTFRQSSQWRDEVGDPENLLYARGTSHRLDAEVLRDIGLWAGGILDPHMGGEGVKPYQPSGLWMALAHPASNTKQYVQDSGRRLYRRSLYVYWKRTSPHPMMTLFDAPSRESSCVRRSRTNTPLQSLGLLNETQRIEMGRMLSERLLREAVDDDSRLDLMFTLLASRSPMPTERIACQNLLERMRGRYQNAPNDAKALLSTGEIARDTELDLSEHAAWTQVSTAVLASDVAILTY